MIKFLHTLSFPEHLWLEFFREFFSQPTLLIADDQRPVTNNFVYQGSQIPENRRFDIILEDDMKASNPDILPVLVIEDMGLAALGIAIDRLSNWQITPETSKTRSDLVRANYVFHCCARDRGESRLLAAIVSNAVTVFYDQLLAAGFHHLAPWSIGKTVAVKSEGPSQSYCNTPVQQVFEYQQTWKTIESGPTTATRFCVRRAPNENVVYVRTHLNVAWPQASAYVRTAMVVEDVNDSLYVRTAMDNVVAPLDSTSYTLTAMNVADPMTASGYVRTSMRVGA